LGLLILLCRAKPFLTIISGGIIGSHSCYQLEPPFSPWVNNLQESFYIVNPGTKMMVAPKCVIMYGGGLTSYEASRRAIDIYGKGNVEVWFADTKTEDPDLYRFNDDVERLLDIKITYFSQGVDIWGIFKQQRMIGNSRIDPCSKYLKRVPLRDALDRLSPGMKCSHCQTINHRKKAEINIVNHIEQKRKVYHCPVCCESDSAYGEVVAKLLTSMKAYRKYKNLFKNGLKSNEGMNPFAELIQTIINEIKTVQDMVALLDRTMIPQHINGGDLHVVLGMDDIEDCDRIDRARSYWQPYTVEFPLTKAPIMFKHHIAANLAEAGVPQPRLYDMGFAHNNCGGFCVKAGQSQFRHLLKLRPTTYAYHEGQEKELQLFLGKPVTVLTETVNGQKMNLSMQALRERIESGGEIEEDDGEACSCLNPIDESDDHDHPVQGISTQPWLLDKNRPPI
jgi:hypothetical protein